MPTLGSDVQFRVSQSGAEKVAQDFEKINQQTDRAGKSTSGLSKFIREQRTEQRQQNFLFREGAQAVGAITFSIVSLTSASGAASKSQQQLNQTLVSGYSAFQAADFAMAALGVATGGVSTAIKVVLGLGAGLLSFLNNSADAAQKNAESYALWKKAIEDLDFDELFERLDQVQRSQAMAIAFNEALKASSPLGGVVALIFGKDTTESEKKINELWDRIETVFKKRQTEFKENIFGDESSAGTFIKRMLGLAGKGADERFAAAANRGLGTGELVMGGGSVIDVERVRETLDWIERSQKKQKEEARLIREEQAQFISELAGGFDALGNGLDRIGVRADSLVQKLISAIQAAVQIAELMRLMEIGAMGSTGGILGIIGAGIGGLSGLLQGGGRGGTVQIQGSANNANAVTGGKTIIIQTMDAGSLRDFISQPRNARALFETLEDFSRKGKG